MDIRSKPNRSFELDNPIKFTYPILIRIILGIGGPAFLVAAVYTSPLVREQRLALWVPLLFLIVGLMSVLLVYIFSGQIVIDSYAVSFQRFSKKIIIPFTVVLKIEHRVVGDRLVIQGLKCKIIIEKQLKDYMLFYSLLDKLCPNKEREASLSFPIQIHSRLWLPVFSVVIILVGFGSVYYAFRYAYIPIGILGMLVAVIGAGFFIYIPRRYIFNARGLTAISFIREKLYRAEDLYELQLNRPFNQYSFTETSLLVLKFETGKVFLQDFAVDFPLEVLAKTLYERYPRLSYGSGTYDEEAETAWPGAGPLAVRKRKTKLVAFLIAAVTLLGVGAILFLARTESQFQAHTPDLSILDEYPNPGPWIILRPGPHASTDTYHTWNQSSFGLFRPWIVTDVAADDPLEYYQKIDLKITAVYAMFTLFFAATGWQGVYSAIRYWNKRARNLD